jgi:hypothetical protein
MEVDDNVRADPCVRPMDDYQYRHVDEYRGRHVGDEYRGRHVGLPLGVFLASNCCTFVTLKLSSD